MGALLRSAIWLTAVVVLASMRKPGLIVMVILHVLVIVSEEPALRRRFGAAYDDYCRRVPRWIPRLP